MTRYEEVHGLLREQPLRWLITGAAGFIGSNLLEALLALDQSVVGLDNFATGHRRNLDDVRRSVSPAQWARFALVEGDIREPQACRAACAGVDAVLHQAALGSVPASIADPATSAAVNIGGFVNLLVAARDAGVRRFVYAASSASYGDHPDLPQVEARTGRLLSPYAVTKTVNELYAEVFHRCYGFDAVGLRYFNVFGRRQDPAGAYAAVIPQWIAAMALGREVFINGDGETSRDFCCVADVVQANLLAACAPAEARNRVYNVAAGRRTSLLELHGVLRAALADCGVHVARAPAHREFRSGDVRHSQADIGLAARLLGYAPSLSLAEGMAGVMPWYVESLRAPAAQR